MVCVLTYGKNPGMWINPLTLQISIVKIYLFKRMKNIFATQSIYNTLKIAKKMANLFVCDFDSLGGEYNIG